MRKNIFQPEIEIFSPSIMFIFRGFFYLIASILLIHLFSIGGIFLAFAFPLWWFIFPTKITCFFCRKNLSNNYCPVCREPIIDKNDCHPKNIRSVVINVLLIVGLTLLSILFLYGETKILNYFGIPKTPATVSFVIPSKGQYQVGEIFPMEINIIGIATPINAIQADFRFDSQILEVTSISTEGSFANIFLQKEIDNDLGFARLTGGLPNPGFAADRGLFGTIYFRGKEPGIAEVEFLPTSLALANDGHGTNVLKDFDKAAYLILPQQDAEDIGARRLDLSMIEPAVAEAATGSTQLIFYEEDRVLGAETDNFSSSESATQDSESKTNFFELGHSLNKIILSIFFKYTIYLVPVLFLFLFVICLLAKLKRK
jgi:hypothetical protein